jgi:sulfur-oxidizing protein SoxY
MEMAMRGQIARTYCLPRRTLLGGLAAGALGGRALAQAPAQEDPWPSLAAQIFNDRPLRDGKAILAIDAPYRAEDAALVPLAIRLLLPPDDTRQVRAITCVIDANPSPLAATWSPGPGCGVRAISTRVRIDSYTNVHVAAELSDGQLYATKRFVKAAGGCSAPAAKQETNAIPPGTMRFRQFPPAPDAPSGLREAQLMIRHPNYSGMQMDQLTRLYVPAHFIKSVHLWQGDDPLLAIESGISISENPEFRFDYRPNGATLVRAEAEDNEGNVFKDQWSATPA